MEELDLSQLLKLFWNNKIQILLIVLIFMVLGVIYTMCFVEPVYTSYTTLLLATEQGANSSGGSQSITATDITLNSKLVATYGKLVESDKVLNQVISNLGLDITADSLKSKVAVKAVADTEMIKISVTNKDPEVAEKLTNEIAKVFTEQVKEYYKLNNVHVVDEAKVEDSPSNVNHNKDVMLFALIGVVISVVYVLLANMFDKTVKSTDDIEKLCSTIVLASIPLDNFDGKKGGRR